MFNDTTFTRRENFIQKWISEIKIDHRQSPSARDFHQRCLCKETKNRLVLYSLDCAWGFPNPELYIDRSLIKVVNEVKFLGLVFDQSLRFHRHLKYLKIRSAKALNILKILANTHWGADRTSLLRLYRALIRSKLDYGSVVYSSACKSLLKILDPVHHQALRLYSLSALQSIVSLHSSSHPILVDITYDLANHLKKKDIRFCWIPGLAGITGNELADTAARSATGSSERFPFPNSDLKACFRLKLQSVWQSNWDQQTENKLHSIMPILAPTAPSLSNRHVPVTLFVTPNKSLNSCRGVILEPDLMSTSESEILEGFSEKGLIQQTSCRRQLTCSRGASVGHSSTDCTLEPKCIRFLELHPSDSRFCPKLKIEKHIQEIKTNKNISYPEARKLIVPQKTQTYAQVVKTLTISTTTQTYYKITQIICPPLKLLQRVPKTSSCVLAVSTSTTQANLLMSTSSTAASISETRTPIPTSIAVPPLIVSRDQSSSCTRATSKDIKENCKRKKIKNPVKKTYEPEIEIKLAPHKPRESLPIHDSLD
ncbi:uncharacterized protein TNCV_493251 [Trichonephila clavipes]|nr:uncharacterized protein TNCV_493251 [Trichonephila clavipes]